MPTNLYGPGDNYDLKTSHVLLALLRKFHEAKVASAKEVVLWGSGSPLREFLHCDDLADALVFLLKTTRSMITLMSAQVAKSLLRGLQRPLLRSWVMRRKLSLTPASPTGHRES